MVAPGEFSDLSRSLVRVPGSGTDKSAKPSTCNLGCVSTLAATVPINPQLPAIITHPRGASSIPTPPAASEAEAAVKKLSKKTTPGGPVRNGRTQPVPSQPYNIPQRSNTQEATTTPAHSATASVPVSISISIASLRESMSNASNLTQVNTQAGPMILMNVNSEGSKLHTGSIVTNPPVPVRTLVNTGQAGQEASTTQLGGLRVSVMTLEQVLKQQDTLRRENAQLQQQVNRYRQLFQSPEKLRALIRHLGINMNQN